jgi:phosphoribosylamine--glycine ligase
VFCSPGNGGTVLSRGITNIEYEGFEDLGDRINEYGIDFVVVGPEEPLAEGVTDYLIRNEIPVFGFPKKTAQLEASKGFADRFKGKYGVQSPDFEEFSSYEDAISYIEQKFEKGEGVEKLWIKADELCGGKGVIGVETVEEGATALTALMKEKKCGVGEKVIVQDHVPGEEITVQAVTDGSSFVLTPPSQDHKPLYEGDKGPNTGGMGAYAPAPAFDAEVEASFKRKILDRTAVGLERENLGGPGVIYFGLGLSDRGSPQVLEYNVRFGDPEAQVVLRLLDSDLYPLLKAAGDGRLAEAAGDVRWGNGVAVCVVLAAGGYPRDYGDEEYPIEGIEEAEELPGIKVYHSGTSVKDDVVYTDGGRILSVTATGDSVGEARKKVYRAVDKIDFRDMYFRSDIGKKALR